MRQETSVQTNRGLNDLDIANKLQMTCVKIVEEKELKCMKANKKMSVSLRSRSGVEENR